MEMPAERPDDKKRLYLEPGPTREEEEDGGREWC